MRILIASDGSRQAQLARTLLSTLQIPEGSALHALSVLPSPTTPDMDSTLRDGLIANALDMAAEKVAAFADPLRTTNRTTTSEARIGRPATTILTVADAFAPDLIVMGSHGRKALGLALMGSVTAEVIGRATCPVLVSRTPEIHRITYATDGSECAKSAGSMLTSGLFLGAAVTCVSVWHAHKRIVDDVPRHLRSAALRAYAAEVTQQRKATGLIANAAAARLRDANLAAVPRLREGPVTFEILNELRESEADLIALGVRGRSNLTSPELGAVARNVLLQSSCSVLIAPA